MPKYTDKRMLGFQSVKGFEPIEQQEFAECLDKVDHKSKEAARAILILLYYTGCRPIEALELTRNSFKKEGRHLIVFFPGVKGGNIGSISLSLNNKHIVELAGYVLQNWFPEQLVFFELLGVRKMGVKFVKIKNKGGDVSLIQSFDKTYKVRYLVQKTFGTVPYFFRHNRFSRAMMKGASLAQIKELKRAKSEASCYVYLHFSMAHKKQFLRFVND